MSQSANDWNMLIGRQNEFVGGDLELDGGRLDGRILRSRIKRISAEEGKEDWLFIAFDWTAMLVPQVGWQPCPENNPYGVNTRAMPAPSSHDDGRLSWGFFGYTVMLYPKGYGSNLDPEHFPTQAETTPQTGVIVEDPTALIDNRDLTEDEVAEMLGRMRSQKVLCLTGQATQLKGSLDTLSAADAKLLDFDVGLAAAVVEITEAALTRLRSELPDLVVEEIQHYRPAGQ